MCIGFFVNASNDLDVDRGVASTTKVDPEICVRLRPYKQPENPNSRPNNWVATCRRPLR